MAWHLLISFRTPLFARYGSILRFRVSPPYLDPACRNLRWPARLVCLDNGISYFSRAKVEKSPVKAGVVRCEFIIEFAIEVIPWGGMNMGPGDHQIVGAHIGLFRHQSCNLIMEKPRA